jgi:hypothetical protein
MDASVACAAEPAHVERARVVGVMRVEGAGAAAGGAARGLADAAECDGATEF